MNRTCLITGQASHCGYLRQIVIEEKVLGLRPQKSKKGERMEGKKQKHINKNHNTPHNQTKIKHDQKMPHNPKGRTRLRNHSKEV